VKIDTATYRGINLILSKLSHYLCTSCQSHPTAQKLNSQTSTVENRHHLWPLFILTSYDVVIEPKTKPCTSILSHNNPINPTSFHPIVLASDLRSVSFIIFQHALLWIRLPNEEAFYRLKRQYALTARDAFLEHDEQLHRGLSRVRAWLLAVRQYDADAFIPILVNSSTHNRA